MGTPSSEINDLFLTLVDDYRLTVLYQTSGSAALTTYLEGWLLYSISEFDNICNQDLTYSTTTQAFTETLTQENQLVLAQMMTKYWLQKIVQNVLQMTNNVQDHDFKQYSQAQNLKEKKDFLNAKKEEISQLLEDYALKYNDWDSWNIQLFGGA